MRIGDVIYDNDTVLIASASFNKEEPCKECFFYDGHECQSNPLIDLLFSHKSPYFTQFSTLVSLIDPPSSPLS